MSNLAKLSKQAVQLEHDRQFDKALALYARLFDEAAADGEEVDVALFNRAGDVAMRLGDSARAVGYFERAIDAYATGGLLNNAIAVSNKLLRQAPDHAPTHYTLAVLHAKQGFRGDAKYHFVEYAERMHRAGRDDEALKALTEFAALCPADDDARTALSRHLAKGNRGTEIGAKLEAMLPVAPEPTEEAAAKSPTPLGGVVVAPAPSDDNGRDLVFLDVSLDSVAAPVAAVAGLELTAVSAELPPFEPEPAPSGTTEVEPGLLVETAGHVELDDEPSWGVDPLPLVDVEDDVDVPSFGALPLLDDEAPEPIALVAADAAPSFDTLDGLDTLESLDTFDGLETLHTPAPTIALPSLETLDEAPLADEPLGHEPLDLDGIAIPEIDVTSLEIGTMELDAPADEPLAFEPMPAEPLAFDAVDAFDEEPVPLHVEYEQPEPEPYVEPQPASTPVPRAESFVDLGDWIRDAEPARSTRITTEDVKPTGDEAADFERMLGVFKAGLARNVDASDHASHYDLGVAFREMGLIEEAIGEFQRAARSPQGALRAREALGQCFLDRGSPELAIGVLERALDEATAGGDGNELALLGVVYLLGEAHTRLGQHKPARACFQRVVTADIEFRDAARRLTQLPAPTP